MLGYSNGTDKNNNLSDVFVMCAGVDLHDMRV